VSELVDHAANAAWAYLESAYACAKADGFEDGLPAYADRDQCLVDGKVDMSALVRVVITAMREPSEAMIEAGRELAGAWPREIMNDNLEYYATPEATWGSMIDAALEP
jgi:hypothetical protein